MMNQKVKRKRRRRRLGALLLAHWHGGDLRGVPEGETVL
jgi:hypothetical protein